MNITRICSTLLFALTLGLGVAACEKHEGPAERAGAKIDNAAHDVKAAAHDVKKDLKN